MCTTSFGRRREGQVESTVLKRYFLHRPDSEGAFICLLSRLAIHPTSHHVATLVGSSRKLFAQSRPRSIRTTSTCPAHAFWRRQRVFFGHRRPLGVHQVWPADDAGRSISTTSALVDLLSHGKYAINEPAEMGDDTNEGAVLAEFSMAVLDRFQFALQP